MDLQHTHDLITKLRPVPIAKPSMSNAKVVLPDVKSALEDTYDNDVLLSDIYYNEFIGCKIHSKHIKG